ncbi:MAG: phage tail sheath subtilisin-like domain-containing protein, partial [Gammaproteobacteria bacterium]|nr:phage tail sheath subtilisin-like domain-containing protein [Gammaproteobacteria bacterium]
QLLLQDDTRAEYVTLAAAPELAGITLTAPLTTAVAAGADIDLQTVAEDADLSAGISDDMQAGGRLALDEVTVAALGAGDVLRIRDTADASRTEFVTISADGDADFDEGTLRFDHPAETTEIHQVTLTDEGTDTTVDLDAGAGEVFLSLADASGFAANGVVRIGTRIHVVAAQAHTLTLTDATASVHRAGVAAIRQVPVLRVHAHHPGHWGDAVRIRVRGSSLLNTTVASAAASGSSPVPLAAVFGLAVGSVLAFSRNGTLIHVQRVISVNRSANEVGFAGGIGVDLQAGDTVRSLEFSLTAERIEDGKVAEAETFEYLALDPEHPRYAPRLVGSLSRATGRASASGAAELIRLSDLSFEDDGATDVDGAAALRLAEPFAGVVRTLTDGDDDLEGIDEATYIGEASDDPEDRTGIHSLANRDDISLVAVPGQTGVDVQNALINHCEAMQYRFAVLDSAPGAKLDQVQTHRQNYDTTRAALYYPWLVISDPFGEKGDLLSIPPSGHVIGIYARVDGERGVHKAPANEIVRGIREFATDINRSEQDILNPLHINCFRDFRPANRGLRVYGARTLSSDAEWKYINVRRLFLFLEKSIENGMQFAVFEPNSEPLWATVKRSLTNFLITVWRSGALEGTKPEEAFFVNVGLNTMTQADIDGGRLIVEIGVAPVKPAEFVIFRISQKTREATG